MTKGEALRWCAHHWFWGLLRLGAGMVSTLGKPASQTRADLGSIPNGSTKEAT